MAEEKKKILIVDDDVFLLDMYAMKFTQNNFEVSTATDGANAIEKLKGGLVPDIILLDIIMPKMDGFEMLQQINGDKLCENCVKVVLSNKGQQSDIDQGKNLGASGYIVKANATPGEVVKEVLEIFNKK